MTSVPEVPERVATSETAQLLRLLLDVGRRSGPALARRADLSHNELAALELLMREPLGPSEISRALGVTTAAASGIVDRLVGRGHLERHPHPADGRRTALVLTDSGRGEMIGHLMPMFESLARLDASLTDDERAVVDRYLRGAIDSVRRVL